MNRGKAMAALRLAAIASALLACAGSSLPFPTRSRTVVALIDASDSIGAQEVEASRRAAIGLIRGLSGGDRAAAVVFGGKASVLFPPEEPGAAAAALESARLEAPDPGETDIAGALAAAKDLAAEGPGSKYVYLFSDGRSNSGSSPYDQVAPRAGAAKVAVYALSEGSPSEGLVSEGLRLPSDARAGDRVALSWSLRSDRAREIEYALSVDGTVAARASASLAPGLNEIPLSVDAGPSGRRTIVAEASIVTNANTSTSSLRTGAYLDVAGPAKILVARGAAMGSAPRSPIARSLEAQGFAAIDGGPESLPEGAAGYESVSAVVLDDMPALAMTEAQQASLQDYVSSGGGLLVVGGESSLGRGDYYATPLEEMLPVETDSRPRLQFTRAKLLFVIDHSGSMSESVGGSTKLQAAMRGVAAAIGELDPLDEVGILSFDSEPQWAIPFTSVEKKDKILAALSKIGDGGGTDLASALEEAVHAFGSPGPMKKHAIILTDGLTPEADFKALSSRIVAAGASASTIAIGDETNEALLKDIAAWCGGAFYKAEADKVPSIIDKETVRMTRDLIQEGRIAVRESDKSPIAEGVLEGGARLGGYLVAKPKSLATVLLEARPADEPGAAGEAAPWDPLLAHWRYGNGKVAVFTSDSGKRWLSSWSGSASYNRLWAQAVRFIERASSDSGLRVRAEAVAGGARVVVEARGPDRKSLSSLHLAGRVQGPDGSAFGLKETAPGHYEGFAPLGGSGLFGIEAFDARTGARSSTWAWRDSGKESSSAGPDKAALSLIAASGGGELLKREGLSAPRPAASWDRVDLGLPLLLLAVLLFVSELYLRTTMSGQLERARAALESWWERQKAESDLSRMGRRPRREDKRSDAEKEARFIEMQRKLAERVSRRNRETTGAPYDR
jgi:Uncharacterized membrane protein